MEGWTGFPQALLQASLAAPLVVGTSMHPGDDRPTSAQPALQALACMRAMLQVSPMHSRLVGAGRLYGDAVSLALV